jgi:hypothetical protein
MKLLKSILLASVLAISSVTAFADSVTNLAVGPLPTSLNYGNSFAAATTGTSFF